MSSVIRTIVRLICIFLVHGLAIGLAADVRVMHNADYTYNEYRTSDKTGNYKVICYFTNWSQYRPEGGRFWPENIDVTMCSHLLYAFAKIENGLLAPYEWDDDSTPWHKGLYKRFNDLKKKKPGLRTLLSVGGWNLRSEPFSQMVSTQASRKRFVEHAVEYLRNRSFDGLDVDWEYPTKRGGLPQDRDRFTLLLKELRRAFTAEAVSSHRRRLLLSTAVAAGKENIDSAYDVPAIVKAVDFLNLLSFDLHGSWEQFTGINSPLYRLPNETGLNATLNQDWAVRYWLKKGAVRNKLILGLGLYGRTFTLANPEDHGLGAAANGPGEAGEYTREAGFLSYYEICRRLKYQHWQCVYQKEQKSNYAFHGNQWVGYDDRRSIQIKVAYVRKMKLAGAMAWSLPLDDFAGSYCQRGRYPLLSEIKLLLGSDAQKLRLQNL